MLGEDLGKGQEQQENGRACQIYLALRQLRQAVRLPRPDQDRSGMRYDRHRVPDTQPAGQNRVLVINGGLLWLDGATVFDGDMTAAASCDGWGGT
jgi:hypothetical protein